MQTVHCLVAKVLVLSLCLLGCTPSPQTSPSLSPKQVAGLIPRAIKDKEAWASDMIEIFASLKIDQTPQNFCMAIAVIDQESNFVADPAVPNLGATATKALNDKLEDKLGKSGALLFQKMLASRPEPNNNFLKQLKAVKTERQLDELFRQMFDYFSQTYKVGLLNDTARLLNNGIDEKLNPVNTLGSMQVHIDYAKAHRRMSGSDHDLRSDLYSRYGGLYYGIHRLLVYRADYDQSLYRFADYNSGMYSSRNAAFQEALSKLSKMPVDFDGDLQVYQKSDNAGQTYTALMRILDKLQISQAQLQEDLKKEKTQAFESTKTYQNLKVLYEQSTGKSMPYAIMPKVVITGPKLSRDYSTNWYAQAVQKRHNKCLATAKRLKLPSL